MGGPEYRWAAMTTPGYDDAFVEELIDDVEAYLQRASVLTTFAEGQVEERVRLARVVSQLAADRDGLQRKVDELDARLRALDGSLAVRLSLVPRRALRLARRLVRRK